MNEDPALPVAELAAPPPMISSAFASLYPASRSAWRIWSRVSPASLALRIASASDFTPICSACRFKSSAVWAAAGGAEKREQDKDEE